MHSHPNKIISYSILAKEYERLMSLDKKLNLILNIMNGNGPYIVSVTMIAKANEVERHEILSKPWMMPNYGMDFETNKKKFWTVEEYLAWEDIPVEERRKTYQIVKIS
jgi:hypothetical protein